MTYDEWESSVLGEIREDSLWKMEAYRLSLFLLSLTWRDATKLMGDRRTLSIADQLYRAVGSIGANLSEGYSRGSGRDRARFYEYSLGSARESRHWYLAGQEILGQDVVAHRINTLTQITRLILTMIPNQRRCSTPLQK
jgi:four helix bundle protein